jgi:hypothetical protein
VCPTEGDAAAIQGLVESCFADLQASLSGSPPAPCVSSAVLATGQMTCSDGAGAPIACADTGQDGELQRGATLSYTDNGDGTITDHTTGLMWAKKGNDGSIHDKDEAGNWSVAFSVFIAAMNSGGGFAGYTDWRLPNIRELMTLVHYGNSGPAVDPVFNTGCVAGCSVTTCSCTGISYHWTSTSEANAEGNAWAVVFTAGVVQAWGKGQSFNVRAVRGGQP